MTMLISDAITPENYAKYQVEDSIELNELYQSGVIVTNGVIQSLCGSGGISVQIPVWRDLSKTEPNISSDDPNQKAVPLTPSAFKNVARISHLNQAWGAMDLAAEIAGSDPMVMVNAKVNQYWAGQYQRRLIASIEGIVADSVAKHDSDLVHTDGGLFTASGFIKAAQTMGDHKKNLRAMVVHSEIQSLMAELDLIQYLPDSTGNLVFPTYKGLMLLEDDQCKEEGGVYSCYMLGAGAFGAAASAPKKGLEVVRDGLAGNGGGSEALVTRVSPIIHPMGYEWTDSAVVGDSPTLAELENAANWTRHLSSRKSIPLVVYKCRAVAA